MHRSIPVVLVAVLVSGCTGGGADPAAVRGSVEPTIAAASPTAASQSNAPSPAASRSTAARAVYYLSDTTNGPRLYREFHRRPATTGVVRDAVEAMLTQPPLDDDYSSLWPTGTRVLNARVDRTVEGAIASVDLSRQATTGSAGGAAEAASLQQLVYTVTAAAPAVTAVQLLVEGKPPATLWGHVSTRRPIARGPAADVLGPVWILIPANGRVARGGTFGGEASVFEATVSWELRRGGRVVKKGFTTASTGAPGRGSWSARADVPPGDYELRAFESSAKDGRETYVDDKPLTVT